MSLLSSLAWSSPFRSRMTGTCCSLCLHDVRLGEDISILATVSTIEGRHTIVGHAACMYLDTPSWRVIQFRASATASDAGLLVQLDEAAERERDLTARVSELETELERMHRVLRLAKSRIVHYRYAIAWEVLNA